MLQKKDTGMVSFFCIYSYYAIQMATLEG